MIKSRLESILIESLLIVYEIVVVLRSRFVFGVAINRVAVG